MSRTKPATRRFTLASMLLVAANQLACEPPPPSPTAQQSVLNVQLAGADYGVVTSEPAGISCGSMCNAAFANDTSVTLTAAANAQGSFVKWGGACQGSGSTCTVVVAASTLVTAEFVSLGTPLAALTVQTSGDGTGKIKSQPDGIDCGATCESQFVVGTTVTLTATPDAGDSFAGWGGACAGTAPTCQVSLDAAKQVSATFYAPPPVVGSIAPFYADKAGGTMVTITGSGFQPASQVTIGGAAATAVTYVSPTQLKVTVPANTKAGCAAVVVTNPSTLKASSSEAMAYRPTTLSFATALASSAVAAGPSVVRSADFNRDGKPDLVVAGSAGTLQYLPGAGDGSFGAAVDVYSDASLSALAVADLDNDGKLDVMAVSSSNNKVAVLLGNGDGTFTKKNEYATGGTPMGLALVDVNADGKLDLVTANSGDKSASVLLGAGDGSFAASVDYAIGGAVQAVALGDINNDAYPDIVAAAGDGSVYFLPGNGDGTFQTAIGMSAGGQLSDVALGDLDGDGSLDVAVADNAGTAVSVLSGDGKGSFSAVLPAFTLGTGGAGTTRPYSTALLDIDLDGKLDVVATSSESGLSYFLNQGAGNFAVRVDLAAGTMPQSVIYQDLNGDCLPDVATVDNGGTAANVLLNTSQ